MPLESAHIQVMLCPPFQYLSNVQCTMPSSQNQQYWLLHFTTDRYICDGVSCAKKLLDRGVDANLLLGSRDAAAVHLAAGAEHHSELYTALLLSHSANPNLPYV